MPESFEEETEAIAAYLDGTAAEDQRRGIEDRLPSDPYLADRLALQARLAIMLEALGRQELHRAALAAPRTWIAGGIAAAVLLAALIAYIAAGADTGGSDASRASVRIVHASPGVVVERGKERLAGLADLPLAAGDAVRTAAGESCTLEYAGEAARVEIGEGAEVDLPREGTGKRIGVRRGEVAATVAFQPAGKPFIVVTPHARVEVVGTKFRVRVGPASTRLEVREGRVLLGKAGGGRPITLLAGQYAVAQEGKALVPLPLPAGEAHGLKGEYFDNEDFTKPVMTRIDPRVDFTWRLGAPQPSMDPDYFSVRWTGWVEPAFSETYAFHVVSDDGARLWIDGKLIIDDWKVRGTEERTGSIALEAGKRVELRLEYFDCVSMAEVHLSWSSPSRRKELIPEDRLTPAP